MAENQTFKLELKQNKTEKKKHETSFIRERNALFNNNK